MKMTPSFPSEASNINLLWASLFIEELIRHGINDFCLAPGSRSTPLTLAVANHPKANSHVHFDERGLGFLALGICQASQKPVVIITTSGSAVANLYPAVVEARQSGLPLIILSADRPAALINCGANQAIEQHRIFSNYPVYFSQIVQPSIDIKVNYLLTNLDLGLSKQRNQPAPIHFNFAFAEPLYPTEIMVDFHDYLHSLKNWQTSNQPFTQIIKNEHCALNADSALSAKKVLIIAGKMASKSQSNAVIEFAKQNNMPLFSDIQSSQRAAMSEFSHYDLLLVNENFKKQLQQTDLIIQFGEQLISKRLLDFMGTFQGQLFVVHKGDERIDPNHQLDKRFNCDAADWINAQTITTSTENAHWHQRLKLQSERLSTQIITPFIDAQPLSEITVVTQLDKLLSNNQALFIGNSMPIRIADMFMKDNQADIFTNRGASGIDGLIATTIGIAQQSNKITTLLIGDTSFLYDLNSLSLLKQLEGTFIIIVINNDGGAIFNMLPVPEQQKQTYYQLPHGLNFKASCEQFCIEYHNLNQLIDFDATYNKCLQAGSSLIEITVANDQTAIQLEQLKEQLKYATL